MVDPVQVIIPSFPPSPPESPDRVLTSAPDWFKTAGKPLPHLALPGCPLSLAPPEDLPSPMSWASDSTPPLSPDEGESSSSDDSERRKSQRKRQGYQQHRRTSAPSYFTDAPVHSQLPRRPSHKWRARFASLPVSGSITPMWSIDEESSSDVDEELFTPNEPAQLDPFAMLLPFCKADIIAPKYTFDEKHFVLAHIPTKRLSAATFKPRMPRIPRYQRPIIMVVFCVLLFGSLCMVSYFSQALTAVERSQVVRQGEWMVRAGALAKAESDDFVEVEPGYKPASPVHHSLKTQKKILDQKRTKRVWLKRDHQQVLAAAQAQLVMTKEDELAALMNFITGTTANTLPSFDASQPLDPEVFLPFDSRRPDANQELAELVHTQWDQYPLMVLGKLRDPKMREVRKLFSTYNIKPAPVYVDFDQRADAQYLEPALERLIGKADGPYILLQGKNFGKASDFLKLEKDEKLVETISTKAGVAMAKKLKKNKHAKEDERKENERVLGPRPIFD